MYKLAEVIATRVRIAADQIQQKLVLSDSQLVARSKNGDEDAFTEIVRRYQDFTFRQAFAYLLDKEAAKDVTQDVFVTAYKGIAYIRNDSALRPWLYRVCKNHCLNVIRRRNLERRLRPDAADAETTELCLRASLRETISRLSDIYRDVIILRYYHDLKYDQIAELLDISLSTVKVRLFRAKSMLRRLIEDKTDEMR